MAEGCDEGLADAVLALVEAARNDAAAKVIMQAGEQAARSERLHIRRLDEQAERNEQEYRAVDSALIEIDRAVRARLGEQCTAEGRLEIARILQPVEEMRAENEQRHRAERGRLHAEVMAAHDRMLAELKRAGRKNRQAIAKADKRLLWLGIGLHLAGSILAATAVIVIAFFR